MKLPTIKFTANNTLNAVGALAIVYLLVVLIQTVQHNYQLGQQMDNLKAQINLLQSQKAQLAFNLQYYNTDAFRDREARAKLGLQLPGESVVIIPHTSPTPTPETTSTKAGSKRSNFQQWVDFLAGRSI